MYKRLSKEFMNMQMYKSLSKEFMNMQLKLLNILVLCIYGASLLCLNPNRQNMYLHNSRFLLYQSKIVTKHWNISSIGSFEINVGEM